MFLKPQRRGPNCSGRCFSRRSPMQLLSWPEACEHVRGAYVGFCVNHWPSGSFCIPCIPCIPCSRPGKGCRLEFEAERCRARNTLLQSGRSRWAGHAQCTVKQAHDTSRILLLPHPSAETLQSPLHLRMLQAVSLGPDCGNTAYHFRLHAAHRSHVYLAWAQECATAVAIRSCLETSGSCENTSRPCRSCSRGQAACLRWAQCNQVVTSQRSSKITKTSDCSDTL